uniref:Uncharacterized protein n=1 Tax=Romanomermis culicivorax TaxID=13658 RepID=A0A915HID8_ROMCU
QPSKLTPLPPPVTSQPQLIPQPPQPAILVPPTAPVDVQTPQAASTPVLALDHYGNPIGRPGRYEHSIKRKQQLQEESAYRFRKISSSPILPVLQEESAC